MGEVGRNDNSNLPPHIAVMAFPFGTHAAPLLNITRRLAAAAPEATFSFFGTAESNRSVFPSSGDALLLLHNVKAYNISDAIPEGYHFTGRHQESIELFLEATPGNFKEGFERAVAETGKNITCVLSDAFLWFAADMADELGVPWVPFWTSTLSSLSTHFYTDLIRHRIGVSLNGIADREDEQLDFIPGMSKYRLWDLQEGILIGNLESPFNRMLHRMGQMLPRAAAVFINSFEELEPATMEDMKSKLKKCFTVGPFTILAPPPSGPDETGCLAWLDRQKPRSVVYLGFGSVITPRPPELTVLAEGLEASGAPFLWSIGDNVKAQLPVGFIERTQDRGMLVSWAPQRRVLDHAAVAVFISHGGWNSVVESISSAVPLICRPFFGDQRLNARLVSGVWGIGVTIRGGVFTREGLMDALDLILSKDEGKKMREEGGTLRELARKAVGPEGSSTLYFNALLEIVCNT
uniref:Glycosyltransferase n=1 Tax=Nelumbo nucifera TaxID=4432 RepID=A0A822ZGH1_NELNU|nr:TPA_asm: hypothetical protein HUJ06_000755 [Nelumbo nucifera]